MPIPFHRPIHGIKRKFIGGKMRVVHNPKRHQHGPGIVSIYKDNETSLTHPTVGGATHHHHETHDVMKRLQHELSKWSMHGSGSSHRHRTVAGRGIGTIR